MKASLELPCSNELYDEFIIGQTSHASNKLSSHGFYTTKRKRKLKISISQILNFQKRLKSLSLKPYQ